ncbi:MAG TPA: ATP-binding protein, partial [Nitrospira sp.]|nr:ATP-binding protein [Nitrospira sp.]
LPMSAEASRDLAIIRAQAERISRVTKSILAFSRGTVSTLKPIDINAVVRNCIAMAGERVAALSVQLKSALAHTLPPVMGDRDRLETVFLNLINNAIDAVGSRGTEGAVSVLTKAVQMDGQQWVNIVVSDNGPGIPEAIIGRIFDPFFSTKPAGQGTGLGLFLTYGIVSDHRGRVEVNNEETGASFTVVLPTVGCSIASTQEVTWESQEKS